MGLIMSAALQLTAQEAEIVTIDAIKQALIANSKPVLAANESPLLGVELGAGHRNLVKSWVQHCERLMGVKVDVELVQSHNVAPSQAVVSEDGVIIYANRIATAQQAVLAYHYGVVGLLKVGSLLAGKSSLIETMLRDIPQSALDGIIQSHFQGVQISKEGLLVEYLAQLAQLQVAPTWVQRRESWQRSVLRKLYPKLKWTSDDLHYFIYSAREALIIQRNFH